ncbi:hypothetical protein PQR16_36865, partial [Caballeronia glebae]
MPLLKKLQTECDVWVGAPTVTSAPPEPEERPLTQLEMAQLTSSPLKEKTIGLSTASLIDLSLRNHICFSALRTEHGTAFHLGTIVRTLFASYFLLDAGFGVGELSLFTEVDLKLGETVLSARPERPWSLTGGAVEP